MTAAIAAAAFLLFAEFNGLYRTESTVRLSTEVFGLVVTWGGVFCGLLGLAFATKTSAFFSRAIILGWAVGVPVAACVWRVGLRTLLRHLRRRGVNTQSVAIAGCTPVAVRLLECFRDDPTLGFVVYGVYDDRSAPRRCAEVETIAPVIGALADLVDAARTRKIDVIYITLPMRAEARTIELIRRLADTTATVYFVPDFFVFDLLHARWGSVGDVSVLSILDTPFQGAGGWMKRLEDFALGTVALLMIAPVMVAVAIGVKATSKGPILFRQRRYGLSGKEIYVWKFRTMTVCEDGSMVAQARQNDSRITPFGAFLRRTSLDELPQLFNVVAGSMSLVGPRPHAVAHNELYRRKIQGYMLRHKVKPGITGWAQVNGWRGETDTIDKMERRIEHDLYYIQNWRITLDIRILFLTVFGRRVRQNAR
jgi:putative colanic acid biosynthesis UDP-glucose lipid carrier transferase